LSTLVFDGVSKWYGDTVAVAELTFAIGPGVTGLLGHNGAGKSTALKMLAGFARPSAGGVRVLDRDPATDRDLHRRVGVVTDADAIWPFLTPHGFVALAAEMRGVVDPGAAAERALATVELTDVATRAVAGFSKGMRQRVKLAALNGLDPAQRAHTVELVRRLGADGRTILVSSHVLHEVERMAPRVLVLVNGRLVAEGDTSGIRALLADRPRTIRIEAGTHAATMAQGLIGAGVVESVRLDGPAIVVETQDPDGLARRVAPIARDAGAVIDRIEPLDDDLESVYTYLQARSRGG
jgi:ABC-2 type transport system ATP-binding protein